MVGLNFLALIANRMYIWTPPSEDTGKSRTKKQSKFYEHETPLEVPRCLEFWTFLSKSGCKYCLKNTEWAKYKKALKKVEFDIDANLDITVVLRRLRMHGFALDLLLNKKVIRAFTKLSENKPVRYINEVKPE